METDLPVKNLAILSIQYDAQNTPASFDVNSLSRLFPPGLPHLSSNLS
jgi:hypothetical protein